MSVAFLIIFVAVAVALSLLVMMAAGQMRTVQSAPQQSAHEMDWNALADAELQGYLPQQKINAIRRYRDLTGASLKASKHAVEYIVAHPDALQKRKRHLADLDSADGAGLRDLIAAGHIEEAEQVYAKFMGVDQFTAQVSVERIQQAMQATEYLGDDMGQHVQRLVESDRTAEAIIEYQRLTGTDLETAEQAIELMQKQ